MKNEGDSVIGTILLGLVFLPVLLVVSPFLLIFWLLTKAGDETIKFQRETHRKRNGL